MKMARKSDTPARKDTRQFFVFSFSHKKNGSGIQNEADILSQPYYPLYSARYSSDKELIVWRNVVTIPFTKSKTKNSFGKINSQESSPWETFYKHATFEEILLHPTMPTDIYSIRRDRQNITRVPKPLNYILLKNSERLKYFQEVLMAIRDNPHILTSNVYILSVLQEIMETARWSRDKEKSTEAKNLLKDYLLPSYRTFKTRALPSNEMLRLIRELMVDLAEHLSKECKHWLGEYMGYAQTTKSDMLNELNYLPDCYRELKDWARKNDSRIYKIAVRSDHDLQRLIFRPTNYVNSLLMEFFQISLRSLKDKIKEST